MNSVRNLIILLNIPGLGTKTASSILDCLSEDISDKSELIEILNDHKKISSRIKSFSSQDAHNAITNADELIEKCRELSINIIGYTDTDYPKRLKTIVDPPPILYSRGNLDCIADKYLSVALVGTRNPSEWGSRCAYKIGKELALGDVVVVSGLALGCDVQAHLGCLEVDGKTIGVLAGGLDEINPIKNLEIAEQILLKGGCLISETPLGIKPKRYNFVQRNRIQSGLSQGVIIVETDIKGGTITTANFAKEQHRALGCIRFPAKESYQGVARGNVMLISEGATPLVNKSDIEKFVETLPDTSSIKIDLFN
jgi:DNA processing protein